MSHYPLAGRFLTLQEVEVTGEKYRNITDVFANIFACGYTITDHARKVIMHPGFPWNQNSQKLTPVLVTPQELGLPGGSKKETIMQCAMHKGLVVPPDNFPLILACEKSHVQAYFGLVYVASHSLVSRQRRKYVSSLFVMYRGQNLQRIGVITTEDGRGRAEPYAPNSQWLFTQTI